MYCPTCGIQNLDKVDLLGTKYHSRFGSFKAAMTVNQLLVFTCSSSLMIMRAARSRVSADHPQFHSASILFRIPLSNISHERNFSKGGIDSGLWTE